VIIGDLVMQKIIKQYKKSFNFKYILTFLVLVAICCMVSFTVTFIVMAVKTSQKSCPNKDELHWTFSNQNKVQIKTPNQTSGVCCSQFIEHEDSVYCFGGWDKQSEPSNTLLLNNKKNWQWVRHNGDSPPKRAHAMCWTFKDNFFIYGGENKEGLLNDLWNFDVREKKWIHFGDYFEKRTKANFWKDEFERFWIYGGLIESGDLPTTSNDILIFTPSSSDSGRWERIYKTDPENCLGVWDMRLSPEKTNPACRHSSIVWYEGQNRFLIYGGNAGFKFKEILNDVWEWDGKSWIYLTGETEKTNSLMKYKSTMEHSIESPGSRFGSCGWRFGKHFLVFGGQDFYGVRNDLWSFGKEEGWKFRGGSVNPFYHDLVSEKNRFLNQPSGRVYASCWIDEAEDLVVYFGLDPNRIQKNDPWVLHQFY
jgi:Galactose oxidase, central domain